MFRRTTILFILLPLYFSLTLVLPATVPVRIGFVGLDRTMTSTHHLQRMYASLDTHIPVYVSYRDHESLTVERMQQNELLKGYEQIHTAIEEADGDSREVALSSRTASAQPEDIELSDSVTLVQLDIPTALVEGIADGDDIIIDHVMVSEQVDVLLMVVIEPYDVLTQVNVTAFRSDGDVTVVYEHVAIPSDIDKLMYEALVTTLSYFNRSPLGLVRVSGGPPGMGVSVDDEVKTISDTLVVLEPGMRRLEFSAPGYESSTSIVEVDPQAVTYLKIDMDRIIGPPVLVTSDSGATDVTISHRISQRVPFVWEGQETPFALYAQEEGKGMLTMRFTEPVQEIHLSMRPQWIDPVYATARAQDSTYAALGRTLLFGALTIVVESISRTVASYTQDRTLWQPFLLGAAGATAVSLFDTSVRLFAYYQKTKYSSR